MTAPENPHMTYQQYRTARRLVRECCNYDCGNCLLLDDGEECICPQSITYSLICKWFRAAVLPLDAGLCAALFPPSSVRRRHCRECGRPFAPPRHNTLYCSTCAAERVIHFLHDPENGPLTAHSGGLTAPH